MGCLMQHEPERAAEREHDADDERERVRSHCQNLTPPSPTNSRIPFPFRPAFTVLGSTLTVYTKSGGENAFCGLSGMCVSLPPLTSIQAIDMLILPPVHW